MAELYSQSWDNFVTKLQQDYGQNESRESELSFLFSSLTKWLEKKSLTYWHVQSFKDYIKDDINPLGLRVQIFPSFDNISATFKTAWEHNLKICSMGMMKLLMEEYQKHMTEIDLNIDQIYSKIKPLETHPSFPKLNEKLKIHIELFNKNILLKKEGKFLRDKQACEEGRAYKWAQQSGNEIHDPIPKIQTRPIPPPHHPIPTPHIDSLDGIGNQKDAKKAITP